MENPNPNPNSNSNANNHNPTPTRRIFKANSISRSISMSDTESQTSHNDSFHSPLRSDSPVRSDDPVYNKSPQHYEFNPNSKAIVAYEKSSPMKETLNYAVTPPQAPPPPIMMFSRVVREGGMHQGTEKMETGGGGGVVGGGRGVAEGEVGGGGERRTRSSVGSILRRSKKEVMVKQAALGFRVCELILCLIAFAVMAANKTQGWSGDSFDRYTEYRYLVAVNVIGFIYSGFQTCDLVYYLMRENHIISHPLRYPFNFAIDQILAYLLMSASSSAATRVLDWLSNWGKDEFTEMASASIGMSFLAFLAFAMSSLISGYSFLIRDSV